MTDITETQMMIAATIKHLKNRIDYMLNDHLCEMKEGWDDSVHGFNLAWDIVREEFQQATKNLEKNTVAEAARADDHL